MKLLTDVNLTPRWVSWLKQRNLAAVHWIEVGAADATDQVIFDCARERELVASELAGRTASILLSVNNFRALGCFLRHAAVPRFRARSHFHQVCFLGSTSDILTQALMRSKDRVWGVIRPACVEETGDADLAEVLGPMKCLTASFHDP